VELSETVIDPTASMLEGPPQATGGRWWLRGEHGAKRGVGQRRVEDIQMQ
jgi:hypothetical protein